jgi:hypothetical protein
MQTLKLHDNESLHPIWMTNLSECNMNKEYFYMTINKEENETS